MRYKYKILSTACLLAIFIAVFATGDSQTYAIAGVLDSSPTLYKYARDIGSSFPSEPNERALNFSGVGAFEIFTSPDSPFDVQQNNYVDFLVRIYNADPDDAILLDIYDSLGEGGMQLVSDVYYLTTQTLPPNSPEEWSTVSPFPNYDNKLEDTSILQLESFYLLYTAKVVGVAGEDISLPPSAEWPPGSPFTSETISIIGYPEITVLPPPAEPSIELSNLPARENRVYRDGAEWSFGMEVTNASQVTFSGDGFTRGYENNTVTVTIACDGLASCLDGEKTLTITAGDKTQDVKFDVDNQAPEWATGGTLRQLYAANPASVEQLLTGLGGQMTDAHLLNATASLGLCEGSAETDCWQEEVKTDNWIDYDVAVNSSGNFAFQNLPSQNGQTYYWTLTLLDQAGNEYYIDDNSEKLNYTIAIEQEPYFFQNYSTSPRSPVLLPENNEELNVRFNFTVDYRSYGQDISGITAYFTDAEATHDDLDWYKDPPLSEAPEEYGSVREWWDAVMRMVVCPAWDEAWGKNPYYQDGENWCHQGWYEYWEANGDSLETQKIGQISGAGTGLLFNRVTWENPPSAGTYYPVFLVKGVNGSENYLLRGEAFRVVSAEGTSLLPQEINEVILNSYLDLNSVLNFFDPDQGGASCDNTTIKQVFTAQKRVAPLMEGTVTNPAFTSGNATLEIQIFGEDGSGEINPVTHAYLTNIPIASDGTWTHAYRLGESANPFEVSDQTCHAYFMRFRAVSEAGEASNWTYQCDESGGNCDGAWYAFSFTHQAVADEGSTLAAGIIDGAWTNLDPSDAKVADGQDGYQVQLQMTDKYGNVITHFATVNPFVQSGKYDVYRDTSLEIGDQSNVSALTLGNLFSKQDYFYSAGLTSTSPTVFSDRKLKIGQGANTYELDNLAYGLEVPRDLALGAKIIHGGTNVLHDAQKIDEKYLNKDSDCDGYSDGLELTYWTDGKNSDDSPPANFLAADCPHEAVSCDPDNPATQSCGIPTEQDAFLSYDSAGDLVFLPLYDQAGDINRANTPAAFFRSPLDVKLYYLLEDEDGVWEPVTLQEETWRTHAEGGNSYELKLPKLEIFTGGEVRFRVAIKNLSDTISYDLSESTELLRQIFSFVEQNAQFGDIQIEDVMLVENGDPINPGITHLGQGDYTLNTDTAGEIGLKFNTPDTFLEPTAAGQNDELWVDFSAWPGITNRSLLTTRVLASGKLQYLSGIDPISTLPILNTALINPQLLYLYRADTYPGSTPATEDQDEREMQIQKIKDEILQQIMAASRPLPEQAAGTNFYEKLRNDAVYLGKLEGTEIHLLNNEGKLQDNTGNVINNSLVASYAQVKVGNLEIPTVYAFRDTNIVIGDGEHPVNLPETELGLITVGGNIIVASDLLPIEDNDKALGLAALRERVDSGKTEAYRSDPLPETKENEATPGGNLLVSGEVSNLLAHVFMEGALFPVDFEPENENKNKYLSSVWDFLTNNPLQSTYHYDDREQNRMNQLYVHGLVFSSYNTYGGFKDNRPYSELTEDYNDYNLRLDLRNLRSYVVKEDEDGGYEFSCSPMLLALEEAKCEGGICDPTKTCADVDPRSFIINTATDYGLPKIFQSKGEIKVGEV